MYSSVSGHIPSGCEQMPVRLTLQNVDGCPTICTKATLYCCIIASSACITEGVNINALDAAEEVEYVEVEIVKAKRKPISTIKVCLCLTSDMVYYITVIFISIDGAKHSNI